MTSQFFIYIFLILSILQWIFIFQLLHRFRLLNDEFVNMLFWHGKLVRAMGRKELLSAEDVQKWETEHK